MIQLLEKQDVIELTAPHRSGCSFRVLFKADGEVYIHWGCYCLYKLLDAPGSFVLGEIEKSNRNKPDNGIQPIKLRPLMVSEKDYQETKLILAQRQCQICGYPLFEPKL